MAKKGRFEHDENIPLEQLMHECAECERGIAFGIAYFMFECHLHSLCGPCLQHLNWEWMLYEQCYVCMKLRKEEENRVATYEAKNSLSLIEQAHTCVVTIGDSSKVFEYPSHYRKHNVTSVARDCKELSIAPQTVGLYGLLTTGINDIVIVCGRRAPTMTVLTPEATQVTHALSEGDIIKSGCFITDTQYLICVRYRRNRTYKMQVIHLDATSKHPLTITPRLTRELNDKPIHVFTISRERYGVLCNRKCGYGAYGDAKYINIIQVFPLTSILLSSDTDHYSIQYHLLWGKRVIRLEGSDGDLDNTISVAKCGYFCLILCRINKIKIFSRTGVPLVTMGWTGSLQWDEPSGHYAVMPGRVYYPTAILCTGNGGFIVTCYHGEIHKFTPHAQPWRVRCRANNEDNFDNVDESLNSDKRHGKWDLVRNMIDVRELQRWNPVITESRLWSVEEDDDGPTIRIYNVCE